MVAHKAHNLEVGGSSPPPATKMGRHTILVGTMCLEKRTPSLYGSGSVDGAEAFQASGRGFESRPCHKYGLLVKWLSYLPVTQK